MFENAFKVLHERGFIYQSTNEENLSKLFESEKVTAYVGFDATADSLHVGHLLPIMALSWLEKCGHRPVALMGGGTTMVGDPSGRTETRQVLSKEDINTNLKAIHKQVGRYLDLKDDGAALMVDNSEWLSKLNYIDFLRDVGRHFSVNRMLAAESYKSRLEIGLTFFEFNYMVMQAFDFLHLYRNIGLKVQMGGQDQWGNIVAGIDLIRRIESGEAYGCTFPLLMDPKTEEKFGKTNAGAVWLDINKTSGYNFYQFWRNVDDGEVERLLNMFTYLPIEETKYLGNLNSDELNRAKEILAFEATKLAHGLQEANSAYAASVKTFGAADPDELVKTSSDILKVNLAEISSVLPSIILKKSDLFETTYIDLFVLAQLSNSKGEARRLIRQGGAYLDEETINQKKENSKISQDDWFEKGETILRAGKKRYKRIIIKQ